MLRRPTIAACCLTVLSVATGLLNAYVLEGPKWTRSPVFQLSLGSPGYVLSDGNTSWNNAVSPALTMWNQVIGRIQLGRVLGSSVPVVSGDSYNSLAFSTTVFGQSFGSNTLAVTYYSYSSSAFNESDTLFNKAKKWDSYRGALRFGATGEVIADIQRVALHELGHGIGLDHPDGAGQNVVAVMNSRISDRYTLASDDINGAHALYGAPVTSTSTGSNIFWQNTVTGDRQAWGMNGTTHVSTTNLGQVATAWNMATSGDFNGDGKRDLLFQSMPTGQCTIWLLSGTTVIGKMGFPTVPLPWQVVTAADFNGDGKTDVVLQNPSTGQRVIWLMNRNVFVSSVNLGTVATSWKIVGSGDFNSDGHADILWQYPATGAARIWFLNGTKLISSSSFPTAGAGWGLAGTGDFNGDHKPDVLWQNQATGQRAIWLMNGTAFSSSASLGSVALEWEIRNH